MFCFCEHLQDTDNTELNLWSYFLGETPVKRISTKYLSFRNVHYAWYILHTGKIMLFLYSWKLKYPPLIKFLVLWIRLKLNARHRRKKYTYKYFELVFEDIKFTSLFYTLINFTTLLHKKSRLDIQKNVFSRVGAKIWNEMPNCFKNRPKKTLRKKI